MAASQIRVVDAEGDEQRLVLGVFKVEAAGVAVWIQEVSGEEGGFQGGLQTSLLNNLQDRVATDQDERP